ncbi:MAG TPA: aldehyde dehydrogenase family protein [Rectinema sp.]|nr:aldehyde dehydrogenase family protein [Rectinema sp.]HQN02706.1 aldehyde dehydrogenase family protein [Rectinema sp.]
MVIQDKEQLDKLFESQAERRWKLALTGPEERIVKLKKLRSAILSRSDELYAALNSDFGKPAFEAWLTEVFPCIEEIDVAVRHLKVWMKGRRAKGTLILPFSSTRVRYEPKGRVLIMAPWNYPFQLLIAPLVSAVAAGNCVIAKPSNKTPHTAAFIADLIAGVFDSQEVAIVEGSGSTLGDFLLELTFDHIFFTGSPAVGVKVGQAAARMHAGLTLELGGKSPAILLRGANLKQASKRIAWGKFLNAGQTCIAPDYLFCPMELVGEFSVEMRLAIESFYGKSEEERQASPDYPRIVDKAACARLERIVSEAISKGAKLEFGGRFDVENRYVSPTLLTGVQIDMAIMAEEIFGPILPVLAYDSLDEAIEFIRSRPKPLALYILGKDKKSAERLLAETTSGSVGINDLIVQIENLDAPFGGVGMSGTGSYHGFYGFKTFSHERTVLYQGPISAVEKFYPPYNTSTQKRLLGALKKIKNIS